MYNKINWILGTKNVKLLAIWFKCQYLEKHWEKNTNDIDFGVPLQSYFTSKQSDDAFKNRNFLGNNNISQCSLRSNLVVL